jgi:translocation and assembly module TamB
MQLFLDVDVSLGDDVELSAYGLNANLKGDMSIRQRSPNPLQLGGEIEVVDGIYKQYGQNLEARGQILFVGPINQTRLAIDAVRTIDTEDRVAGLRIQGTLTTPEIILFTEPGDKPQDSILSYIVLGRDINETTDQEANLLAAAALALTVRGGRTIAGGIASALGVKDFAFETRGNGDDTELVISGRLNDRLLLRYGRSVFQPLSTLYLRYDLTKKLYLEAAQSSLEQAVDLFFSFSF